MEIRNSIKIILLNSKNELLLICTDDKSIKNSEGKYNGKFWQLVGGKIEEGESYLEAATRELFEETSLTESDVEFGNIVWYGNVDLNIRGTETRLNQSFIYAKTDKTDVNLRHLTDEEKPAVKFLKWMSLDEIKNCTDIIYPLVLPEYLPDILNGNLPEEPIYIDLAKQPDKKF